MRNEYTKKVPLELQMFGARPRKEITNKQNGRDRKTTENILLNRNFGIRNQETKLKKQHSVN